MRACLLRVLLGLLLLGLSGNGASAAMGDGLLSSLRTSGDTRKTPLPLEFEADEVEGYFDDRVVLRGEARILSREHAITADVIEIDQGRQVADATGNVRLWYRGDVGFCSALHFNMQSRETTLHNGRLAQDDYFLFGEQLIVDASRTVFITNGRITGCDLHEPHYNVHSRKLVVVPRDRIRAYHNTYDVQEVPLLYLPYFRRSLERGPYVHVISVGHSGSLGGFMLNKMHYHYDEYINPSLHVDLFSRAGIGLGVGNWYQSKGPGGSEDMFGDFEYWRIDQQNADDDDFNEGERYRLAGHHFSRFGPTDLELTSIYNRMSDNEMTEDYQSVFRAHGWDQEMLDYDRNTFVQLRQPDENFNARLLYKNRTNDFFQSPLPVDEREPQLHLEMKRRRLWDDGPLLHAALDFSQARLEHGLHVPAGATNEEDHLRYTRARDEFQRGDLALELSQPLHAFGWLNVTPYVGYRATQYTDAEVGRRSEIGQPLAVAEFDDVTRHIGRTGVDLHTRLAHRFAEREDGTKRRLLVEPLLGIEGQFLSDALADEAPLNESTLRAQFGDDYDPDSFLFPQVDEIDAARDDVGRLRYRLDTTYQKRKGEGAVFSPAGAALSGGWNFHRETDPKMEDLITEVYVQPVDWLRWFAHHRFDHNLGEMRSFDTGTDLYLLERKVILTSAYVALRPPGGELADNIHGGLTLIIGPKYTLRWTNRYDVDAHTWRSSRAVVTRDLHDWWLDFGVGYRDRERRDDELDFALVLRFKMPGAVNPTLMADTWGPTMAY